MSEAIQLALMLGPFAVYLYILGIWQSGRRARVVSGSLDYCLLVFGLSGFVLFGPAGTVVLRSLFGPPNAFIWILWCGFVLLWAIFLGCTAGRRLVVYQTDDVGLRTAIEAAISRIKGNYTRTLAGYEDVETGTSITIHPYELLSVGVIQAEGKEPETVCRELIGPLREELNKVHRRGPGPVTWGLFILSWIAMIAPMIALLINEPRMQSIVRQFLQRLQGGG